MAAKIKPNDANMQSVLVALDRFGVDAGLDRLHRLVHYLAQLMHESGAFRYDQEIWGPTAAQQRYDTRTDLGNTPERDGDGYKYRGRAGIQITGKSNYRQFRDWCREQGYNPPDFVANPDAVNSDPWEGLAPIWYWSTRKLNTWADQNDIETITKKINGGKNGLADRIDYYGRIGLVVCGYGVTESEVKRFQLERGLADVDGDVGPKTRAALHARLVELSGAASETVRAAPVVVETVVEKPVAVEVEKPVVPAAVEKEVRQKTNWLSGLLGTLFGGGGAAAWLAGMNWQSLLLVAGIAVVVLAVVLVGGEWIVRRIKSIRREIEA
ncbi:putative chitinase [Neorhizobium huautlense]|uniref:Chitinase n=2 Tax=Neorhizobium huautlense TaxID=67774 RepID=A0ABT9PU26_9HYPH|nr:putative chitinase [Neorhizobium huautlense]